MRRSRLHQSMPFGRLSSPLPDADIVSTLTNLVGSLWLPVRNSLQGAISRHLTFLPNSKPFLIILDILTWLVQVCKVGLRTEGPWRTASRRRLVSRELETDQTTRW